MIEKKLISILLKFPERFEKIYNKDDLFFDIDCKIIFQCMQKLFDENKNINLSAITTISHVQPSILSDIYDLEISDANINLYLEELEIIRLKNKVQKMNNEIQSLNDKNKIIDCLENIIIKNNSDGFKVVPIKNLYIEYIDNYQEHKKNNNNEIKEAIDVPIPFFSDNDFMFFRKEIVIIAGRPGAGKTTYALNIINRLSKKYSSGIITTEQTQETLTRKIISSEIMVRSNYVDSYNLTNIQENNMAAMIDTKINDQIFFVDKGRINEKQIERAVRKMVYEHKIKILMIDYLQRLKYSNTKLARFERVSELSNFMKEIAKEYNLLLFVLAQINRNGASEPTMSDIRDSGDIEQDADKIIILHEHERNGPLTSIIKHIVAKNKTGATGCYFSKFDKNISKFTEIKNY